MLNTKRMLIILDKGTLKDMANRLMSIAVSKWETITKIDVDVLRQDGQDETIAQILQPIHSVPKCLIKGIVLGITALQRRFSRDHPLYTERNIYTVEGPGAWQFRPYNIRRYRPTQVRRGSWRRFKAGSMKQAKDIMYITSIKHKEKTEALLETLTRMKAGLADGIQSAQFLSHYSCFSISVFIESQVYMPDKRWYDIKNNQVYWLLISVMRYGAGGRGSSPKSFPRLSSGPSRQASFQPPKRPARCEWAVL